MTGLNDGDTYTFEVRATNNNGTGDDTTDDTHGAAARVSGTAGAAPNPPTGLAVNSVTDDAGTDVKEDQTQLALSWTAGADISGVTVTDHEYRMRRPNDVNWSDWTPTGKATTVSTTDPYTVMGLVPSTTYEFQVRAVAGPLASDPTDAVSGTTVDPPAAEQVPPADPTGLTASAGNAQVTLSWNNPNDPAITGYVYTRSPGDQTEYRIDVDQGAAPDLTSHTVTGLENSTEYTFTLKAENTYGTSDASATATATPRPGATSTSTLGDRVARVNETVLPNVARAVSASTLSAVTGRIEAAISGTAPVGSLNLAGSSSLYQALKANERTLKDGTLDMTRLLGGSSFTLNPSALGAAEGRGMARAGGLAVWGSGDYRDLSGGDANAVEWDGDLVSGHLGADTRLNENLLAGLSASFSKGAFEYTDRTTGTASGGALETRLTSLNPYASWASEGFGLWATGGYGWGELELDDDDAPESSDLTQWLAAVGVSGTLIASENLIEGGTTRLKLKGEGSLTQVEVEGNGAAINELTVDASRLRLALEGSHTHDLASGGTLTPAVELGGRHDGGDGETGTGVELGGSLRFQDPATGLTLEGHGRTLLSHGGTYEEWGVGGLIRLDPGADRRGVSLSLVPSLGAERSGAQRLWTEGMAGGTASDDAEPWTPQVHLNAELGYGFGVIGDRGLLTPYGGVSLSGEETRHYRLGGRFEIGSGLGMSLEGERREAANDAPAEHGVMFRGQLRF